MSFSNWNRCLNVILSSLSHRGKKTGASKGERSKTETIDRSKSVEKARTKEEPDFTAEEIAYLGMEFK